MQSSENQLKSELQAVSKLPRYDDVSVEVQTRLIEMVYQNGLSVYQAASILSLKNSAAKTILRKHKTKPTLSITTTKTHNALSDAGKMAKLSHKQKLNSQYLRKTAKDEKPTAEAPSTAHHEQAMSQYYPFLNFRFETPFPFFDFYPYPGQQTRLH